MISRCKCRTIFRKFMRQQLLDIEINKISLLLDKTDIYRTGNLGEKCILSYDRMTNE